MYIYMYDDGRWLNEQTSSIDSMSKVMVVVVIVVVRDVSETSSSQASSVNPDYLSLVALELIPKFEI